MYVRVLANYKVCSRQYVHCDCLDADDTMLRSGILGDGDKYKPCWRDSAPGITPPPPYVFDKNCIPTELG